MSKRQVTLANLETEHLQIAKLYKSIITIDTDLQKLAEASFINKPNYAEQVINTTRDTLFDIVSTLHSIKNDLDRLQAASS